MAIIRSFGALQATSAPTWPLASGGSLNVYTASMQTYGAIYRTQPNVRIVIDFIARNIAQLGGHVFRRISDTDRVRLADHDLAKWLSNPNPATTRYRLMESLVIDLGIYMNAYWLKVRQGDALGLVRLPPEQMAVSGGLIPTLYEWTGANGEVKPFAPSEIVHFGGYNPDNPLLGLSHMETLRRILAEEAAAGDYRQNFWQNAGRMDAVIERPLTAQKWLPHQAKAFVEQWQAQFSGGAASGKTAVLEDGMTLKPTSFSAKDSEYTDGGKLRREVCAAEYHVPLPMVGILDHATFSNIREQHKHLYQDCLGPTIVMIEEDIERQLLPECRDAENVYFELNIAEKLKGSFEEQATAMQTAVGRPWMTVNEARARMNLPSHDDPSADTLKQPTAPAPRGANPAADDKESDDPVAAAWKRQPVSDLRTEASRG